MSGFLNSLRLIVAVLPAVIELVQAIERSVPLRGIGADKLELLKGMISDAYEALDAEMKKGVSLEGVLKAAVAIASRLVAFFNKLGRPS